MRIVERAPADAYLAFWTAHAGADLETQVTAFSGQVAPTAPRLFGEAVLGLEGPGEAALAQRLRLYLPAVEPELARVQAVGASLPERVEDAVVAFRAEMPMPAPAQIVLTASLGSFDGMTAELDGVPTILLAVDGIALFHPPGYDVQPLVHHELFHLLHAQRWNGAEQTTLAEALWFEGLATYVSRQLNPEATATEVDGSPSLRAEVQARLPELARAVVEQLDSEDPAVLEAFLSAGVDGDMPDRSGYILGAIAAEQLARAHSLDELMALRGPALHDALRGVFASMQAGGSSRIRGRRLATRRRGKRLTAP